jgi:uncharacterized protein (TIGR03067 family)
MAIVVGSAAAEVQKAKPAVTQGPAVLCGVWRVSAVEQNGERLPEAVAQQMTWIVSDRSITFRLGAKVVAKSAYTVDWKAQPAAINMTQQGQRTVGIIRRDGLGLKVALNDMGKGRPKKLEAREADLFVELKRAEWDSLHVMDADGRNLHRFVSPAEYVWQGSPAWSCDGTRLGFDAWRSIYGETYVNAHIFTCNADGKELKDIGVGAMPSWSPDGKRIAFSNYDPRGVWIMKADGTGRELIDSAGWGVRWCPKAEKIAYSVYDNGANIAVRDLATNGVVTLLDDRYSSVYWGMAWSPDGKWIAFKAQRNGITELAVVHAEGHEKGFRVLLPAVVPDMTDLVPNLCWSPDGKQVLAAVITKANPVRQLYRIDAAGKGPGKPLPGLEKGRWYNEMAWSLDGKRIVVSTKSEEP